MTEPTARPPIESRLAAAGLPPLPRTAWLEIDLDALRANLGVVRGLAGPGQPVRPVVKADAYGHGAVLVAAALEAAGADGFCVAAMDEAVELREGGIRAPILVLYPVPVAWVGVAARLGIAVSGGSPAALAEMVHAAADLDADPAARDRARGRDRVRARRLPHRGPGGPPRASSPQLPGWSLPGCGPISRPHPTTRSPPRRSRGSRTRERRCRRPGSCCPGATSPRARGSSATGCCSDEGVRPGLITYGLVPDELDPASLPAAAGGLRPAMALYARPIRVVELPTGAGISYGPTFRTSRPSRIATLPVGYGDGFSRRLSNRASAIVRGTRVPLVGNVTMDAVMADVTDVAGRPVDATDEFVLLGSSGSDRIDIRDLAPERTTNSWEVVVAMSRRLPRVYHAAAGPVGLRTLTEPRG